MRANGSSRSGSRTEVTRPLTAQPLRLAFVTDIPTPYFVTVMGALAREVQLHVVFCAASGSRGFNWELELPFSHSFLPGLVKERFDNTDVQVNPRLFKELRTFRPDVVVSGNYGPPTALATLFCLTHRVPLIIHGDGTSESEAALSRVQRASRRLLVPRIAAAVANSAPARERFVELGFAPDAVFDAPHTTELKPLWELGRGRAYLDKTPLRLLYVGRLVPRKGVRELITALAAVRERVPVELTIAGAGPEEDALRRLSDSLGLGKAVEFRGFADQPDLPAIYAGADAFVLPTRMDPYALVLLEAMASGLPVIASIHAGATIDLVVDGHNGLAVDSAKTEQLVQAIERLATSVSERKRLGAAAYETTLDRTPERAAKGYVAAGEYVTRATRRRRSAS
jgi:glycosyltransferase involved in cell wall biosynthesis